MNADQAAAVVVPPKVTVGGREYVGRILSAEQYQPFGPWFLQAAEGTLIDTQVLSLYALYLRAVFPWRPWMLWQGDPVRRILRQPWTVVQAVMLDFFGCQVASMASPVTSGTDSASAPSPAPTDGAPPAA